MGLVVQERVMYEGSLWLSTCRWICLTLVQIKKIKKEKRRDNFSMSDKTGMQSVAASHKWPSASLAVS